MQLSCKQISCDCELNQTYLVHSCFFNNSKTVQGSGHFCAALRAHTKGRRKGGERVRTEWGHATSAARSDQSCLTLCDPIDDSPPGSPIPGFNPWVRKIWRRKWQPSPVFLPGKSHGWRNLVGYSLWGCKELDMTERLHFDFTLSHQSRILTASPSLLFGHFWTSLVTQTVKCMPSMRKTQVQSLA